MTENVKLGRERIRRWLAESFNLGAVFAMWADGAAACKLVDCHGAEMLVEYRGGIVYADGQAVKSYKTPSLFG